MSQLICVWSLVLLKYTFGQTMAWPLLICFGTRELDFLLWIVNTFGQFGVRITLRSTPLDFRVSIASSLASQYSSSLFSHLTCSSSLSESRVSGPTLTLINLKQGKINFLLKLHPKVTCNGNHHIFSRRHQNSLIVPRQSS